MADRVWSEKELVRRAKRRLAVLQHAEEVSGSVAATCRYYGISRTVFYRWKRRYEDHGIEGLKDRSSAPMHCPNVTQPEVVEKIIHLRQHYHFGPLKIAMYLQRYHDITISHSGVWRILKRLEMNRLPASQRYKRHGQRWKRYEKQRPGHHVQIDVKFIEPVTTGPARRKRYYQYTAIDDCTRLRVLRIYPRSDQKTAIQFLDYVLAQLPFQVEKIQTDNGAEFQSAFHWHVVDQGIGHTYIRPATPRLNGKVERSHRIDAEEFYRLLDGAVIDDAGVFNDKLQQWQDYYNYHRPHGGLDGQTPYERLLQKTRTQPVTDQRHQHTRSPSWPAAIPRWPDGWASADGDLDGAWAAATEYRASPGTLFAAAEQRAGAHPADAIPLYAAEVDTAIDRKDKAGYPEAARLLLILKDLHHRAGTDFRAYLDALTDTHRRKTTLLATLTRAGI